LQLYFTIYEQDKDGYFVNVRKFDEVKLEFDLQFGEYHEPLFCQLSAGDLMTVSCKGFLK